jgi:hypothetical protein
MGYYPYQPPARQRPTVVTVIAILFIAFGAMGLLMAPMAILQMRDEWPGSQFMQPLFHAPGLGAWMKVSMVLSPLFYILLIAAGIGLLQLRRWGLRLAIGVMALWLLTTFVGAVVMVPAFSSLDLSGMFPPGSPPAQMMRTIMAASAVVGVVIGVGMYGLVLVLLTRPHVRQAFEPVDDTTGGSQ